MGRLEQGVAQNTAMIDLGAAMIPYDNSTEQSSGKKKESLASKSSMDWCRVPLCSDVLTLIRVVLLLSWHGMIADRSPEQFVIHPAAARRFRPPDLNFFVVDRLLPPSRFRLFEAFFRAGVMVAMGVQARNCRKVTYCLLSMEVFFCCGFFCFFV